MIRALCAAIVASCVVVGVGVGVGGCGSAPGVVVTLTVLPGDPSAPTADLTSLLVRIGQTEQVVDVSATEQQAIELDTPPPGQVEVVVLGCNTSPCTADTPVVGGCNVANLPASAEPLNVEVHVFDINKLTPECDGFINGE